MVERQGGQTTGPGRYGGWGERRLEDYKHTPYLDINAYRGLQSAPWFQQWYRQNKSTDPYWAAIAYQGEAHYSQMTVPALAFSGWFDVNYPGTPMNYAGMKNVFVMGENRWHAERDWPLPEAIPTKYYLGSGGHANSLGGDGVLTTTLPREESVDQYVYDPRTPTLDPFEGFAEHNGHIDAALDTRGSAIGNDVLVYQTPPLVSPTEVTGPIEATLYAATSARDTDWMVRLVDVQPDGHSMLLTEGVLRARNRDPAHEGRFNAAQLSTIESDHIYRYTIRFWRGTGNLFNPGHRIRIEISSSWYPYYLPNLNTGADNVAMVSMTEAVVAHQAIHHGPRHPSHFVLPVIPPRIDASTP